MLFSPLLHGLLGKRGRWIVYFSAVSKCSDDSRVQVVVSDTPVSIEDHSGSQLFPFFSCFRYYFFEICLIHVDSCWYMMQMSAVSIKARVTRCFLKADGGINVLVTWLSQRPTIFERLMTHVHCDMSAISWMNWPIWRQRITAPVRSTNQNTPRIVPVARLLWLIPILETHFCILTSAFHRVAKKFRGVLLVEFLLTYLFHSIWKVCIKFFSFFFFYVCLH